MLLTNKYVAFKLYSAAVELKGNVLMPVETMCHRGPDAKGAWTSSDKGA